MALVHTILTSTEVCWHEVLLFVDVGDVATVCLLADNLHRKNESTSQRATVPHKRRQKGRKEDYDIVAPPCYETLHPNQFTFLRSYENRHKINLSSGTFCVLPMSPR